MSTQDRSEWVKPNPEWEEHMKSLPGPPPSIEGDIPAMRKMLADRKRQFNATMLKDNQGVEISNITIPARDGYQIPARLYLPESSNEEEDREVVTWGNPVVVFFHGGGFCLGGLENEDFLCIEFTKKHHVVCLNVAYRLAPEDPFPAAINDAWDATKWVTENAKSMGATLTNGFLVGGVSAGGNLAAVVAHLSRDEKLQPPVTGTLLCVPVIMGPEIEEKYASEIRSYEELKDGPILNEKSLNNLLGAYKPDRTSRLYNLFAEPTNFSGLPPTYLEIAGADPLRDEAVLYEKLLREANVTTKYRMWPGLPHGFWSFAPEMTCSKEVVDDIINAVGWLLKSLHK